LSGQCGGEGNGEQNKHFKKCFKQKSFPLVLDKGQSLVTKLVVILCYNFIQYLFIGGEL